MKSVSPLSMSRYYTDPPRKNKESHGDYDDRTWRERLHYTESGEVFINNMAFKWCITDAAKQLGMKVPGKGAATYAKYFVSGILVLEGMTLGIKKDDVQGERLFVPANGKHGGGTRVWRTFPLIPSWEGEIAVHILNRSITKEVFEEHIVEAGAFTGLGRFRPQNGGFYGRFELVKLYWNEN